MTDATEAAAPADELDPTTAPAGPDARPADTPADPAPEDAAPSTDETPGDDPADEPARRKGKGGFQKRIDELTRKNFEADLRARHLQRELDAVRQQTTPDYSTDPGPEPTVDQFHTIDEFQKALKDWTKHVTVREFDAAAKRRDAEEAEIAARAAFNAREASARARYADYDQVIAPIGEVFRRTPVLTQYALESDMSNDMAYHLGKNPAVLLELIRMTPVAALRELGRLEARLSAPPPPPPLTNAPAPIQPVGTREAVAPSLADLAGKDDVSAYIARANKARG